MQTFFNFFLSFFISEKISKKNINLHKYEYYFTFSVRYDVDETLWDLGLNYKKLGDQESVSRKIRKIEMEMDLVLITEMFNESIIMLKDRLCWNLEDMTYIRQNERSQKFKSNMTIRTRSILQQWLWADYQLYYYFLTKFKMTLDEINPSYLQNQLETLELLNKDLKEKCQAKVVDNESVLGKLNHMGNDMVIAYSVVENCTYYVISEP